MPPRMYRHLVELVLLLTVFRGIRSDLDVAVVFHTGTCRDQASHDDVFLQAAKIIDASRDSCFGKHAGRFLEAEPPR